MSAVNPAGTQANTNNSNPTPSYSQRSSSLWNYIPNSVSAWFGESNERITLLVVGIVGLVVLSKSEMGPIIWGGNDCTLGPIVEAGRDAVVAHGDQAIAVGKLAGPAMLEINNNFS